MSSCLVACLHNLAITFMHELCMSCGRAQTRPWPLSTLGLCLCCRWLQIRDWGKVKFELCICFKWCQKLGTVYMLKMIQFGTVHWACHSSKLCDCLDYCHLLSSIVNYYSSLIILGFQNSSQKTINFFKNRTVTTWLSYQLVHCLSHQSLILSSKEFAHANY